MTNTFECSEDCVPEVSGEADAFGGVFGGAERCIYRDVRNPCAMCRQAGCGDVPMARLSQPRSKSCWGKHSFWPNGCHSRHPFLFCPQLPVAVGRYVWVGVDVVRFPDGEAVTPVHLRYAVCRYRFELSVGRHVQRTQRIV